MGTKSSQNQLKLAPNIGTKSTPKTSPPGTIKAPHNPHAVYFVMEFLGKEIGLKFSAQILPEWALNQP
jgi:hypothetical protein